MMFFRCVILGALLGGVAVAAGPPAAKPTVAALAWLSGCWLGTGDEETMEQWMKPAGGTMLGMSRTVADGRTVAYEFIVLRERDGAVYYVARPSGQEEASFKLVRSNEREAVFENPEHDFPQRITYRLWPDGSLEAAIEGIVGGKTRRVEYPMKRIRCE